MLTVLAKHNLPKTIEKPMNGDLYAIISTLNSVEKQADSLQWEQLSTMNVGGRMTLWFAVSPTARLQRTIYFVESGTKNEVFLVHYVKLGGTLPVAPKKVDLSSPEIHPEIDFSAMPTPQKVHPHDLLPYSTPLPTSPARFSSVSLPNPITKGSIVAPGFRQPPQVPTRGDSIDDVSRGLTNETGENNCFLNGVLQILWHCKPFNQFIVTQNHRCFGEESCLFCQLKVFSHFSLFLSCFLPFFRMYFRFSSPETLPVIPEYCSVQDPPESDPVHLELPLQPRRKIPAVQNG